MDYRVYPPSPALRPWVRHYWTLKGAGVASQGPIYPDGCVEIAIHLQDPFSDANGRQHHSLFIGQMNSPFIAHSGERTSCVGIKFEPYGAALFLPMPLDEIEGFVRPLEDTWPAAADLRYRLAETSDEAELVAILDDTLFNRMRTLAPRRDAARDAQLQAAIRSLLDGNLRIDSVAGMAGISTRQFERRVRMMAGASPKLLARVARFQRALAQSQENASDWASIAADCGYFDQAHLIRDFRQFTGTPPTRCEPGSALSASRLLV